MRAMICNRCRRRVPQTKVLNGRQYCQACYDLVEEILSDVGEESEWGVLNETRGLVRSVSLRV